MTMDRLGWNVDGPRTCFECGRTEDEPHAAECAIALEQDAADGDRTALPLRELEEDRPLPED